MSIIGAQLIESLACQWPGRVASRVELREQLMSEPLVALIEIGKAHSQLALVDPQSGAGVHSRRRANNIVQGSCGRELDVTAIEQWLLDALRTLPHKERVRAIVPIAHGSAMVLLSRDGRILAAPDHDDSRFDSVSQLYRLQRDAYERTYSPNLPRGLNLGRQLFFVQEMQPELFSEVAHVLLYPQFWAWRLSGVMASEVTSLGCHSDLWLPVERTFSTLAHQRGWSELLPPIKFAGDLLGPVSAQVAAATGLDAGCQVACGIHDSSAIYLKFLIAGNRDEPFAVICGGAATMVMANQSDVVRLRENHDMLANVDAFGSPVATARFRAGSEYAAIAGTDARANMPALINAVERRAMALPAFATGGPFAGHEGKLLNVEHLSGSERAGVATLYVALTTELSIESLGARGDIIIDGPLAANPLFGSLLASWLPSQAVYLTTEDGGNTQPACYLGGFSEAPSPSLKVAAPLAIKQLAAYREAWRNEVLR